MLPVGQTVWPQQTIEPFTADAVVMGSRSLISVNLGPLPEATHVQSLRTNYLPQRLDNGCYHWSSDDPGDVSMRDRWNAPLLASRHSGGKPSPYHAATRGTIGVARRASQAAASR